jgi:hypothetical protein
MSALGQKQTFALHQSMSALPPKADSCSAQRNVCFGPKADIGIQLGFLFSFSASFSALRTISTPMFRAHLS